MLMHSLECFSCVCFWGIYYSELEGLKGAQEIWGRGQMKDNRKLLVQLFIQCPCLL